MSAPPAAPQSAAGKPTRATLLQLLRHHLVGITATVVDYGVMISCVELGHARPVPATALGALGGALTSFTLGRLFTYRVTGEPLTGHAWRYALVSAASLGWNSAGEALFHDVLGLQYMLARVITSLIVSNAWNYPLQRFFVFSRRPPPPSTPAPRP
jgi:putative flippase GtrA